MEYFISTHGARKGTTDTALKTAQAGYLARRLVDVCQDLCIKENNCRTKEGIEVHRSDSESINLDLSSRLFGRTLLEEIKDGKTVIAKAGQIVDKETAKAIENSKVDVVKVKSPITCKSLYGLCSKCYGFDLGTNKQIEIGEAVGVVAAQSISEPGTQLTMRTFHTGGVAGTDITHGLPRIEEVFEARLPKGKAFVAEEDGVVEDIESKGLLKVLKIKSTITSGDKKKDKLYEFPIHQQSEIFFKKGDKVLKGAQLCEGRLDIKEVFQIKGGREVERYIINEIQNIYSSEGASISDKHIEVVVRQMFSRVQVKTAGSTEFIPGDVVEKSKFIESNRETKEAGGEPAKAKQLLFGITKVALSTESFLSAASFIETAKVLINAAIEGKQDVLRGLKENVIIGRLIPVGTGVRYEEEPESEEVAEKSKSKKS